MNILRSLTKTKVTENIFKKSNKNIKKQLLLYEFRINLFILI